jgi:glucose/arabinose dehydrogenase
MFAPAGSRRAVVLAALFTLFLVAPAHAIERGGPFDASRLPAATAELVQAASIPPGFTESVAFSGLTAPTAVRFASNGRVVVAEKSGLIKVFDNLSDTTPTVVADLRTQVHDYWDRGLLGIALDPNYASNGTLYVLYAYNKSPDSSTVPRWPDSCPSPPGPVDDGCVITGRLSRISSTGVETPLIDDWCQQYPSHSVGSLAFGQDGALYVSGGDGASFNFADYGTDGNPINPCGDPPGGVGGSMTPPTAEGGALRSQDIRTSSDPTGLNGSILRLNPATGAAMTGNANIGSADPNTRRIIATGLRNPFRFTMRPGTNEVWVGDVGWSTWEEIDRIVTPTAPTTNFGWPCYEGNARQSGYDNLNLNICENLYTAGDTNVTAPYYTYNHSAHVVPTESCPTGGSSISGLAFTPTGSSFGTAYDGSLFFADYSRNCIWVMRRGTNGLPDPTNRQVFVDGAAGPVDLQFGPGGDLYYVDMNGGTIRRIRGSGANQAPTAVATANPTSGAVPLAVSFDGLGSTDPDGDALTYAWDLDGDGQYDDSTSSTPSFTYTTAGTVTVGLRVSDPGGNADTTSLVVTAGTPPNATINSPAAGTTWVVGDTITFSGSATDFRGAALPPSALSWRINLLHCSRTNPSSCHTHVVQSLTGAGGSFVAPDHEYPSHLEIELTATDSFGLTRTVTRRLDPRTVPITMQSQPAGVSLTLGTETATAPFTLDVIQGSKLAITAPTSVTVGGATYDFSTWSDGGARTHDVTAGNSAATYTATFAQTTTPTQVAGTNVIGQTGSDATAGSAEVYRTTASANARVTSIALRVAPANTASAVVLGLYADSGGQPTTLLATGRINNPQAGAWNEVPINGGPTLTAGTAYWIGLLNPSDATGVLRWHDRAGGAGGAEQGSASGTLSALPTTWARGQVWSDGPLSAYVMGVPPGPPPPPALSVSPTSLAFSATAGGANPASKTISVTNTGGGSLSFTASDDASWLTVSPASGSAPTDLTAAVNTSTLSAGTYTATVTVTATGVSGSPKTIPVTLTVNAPTPPALSVTPTSLSFSAVEGGAAPSSQSLAVANTGGGTLTFTTSDNASWLAATPASGTAPGTVAVSVTPAGLTRGTYTGSVQVTASGATGSPANIPVTLTVTPPSTGLVGAWGFDEAAGTTALDSSGSGNPGTVSGATRTTGKYGGALTFDGVNDWVTVPDANALDVNRMTLEAWVRPTGLGDWRAVLLKEQPGQLVYALYASTDTNRPSGHVFTSGDMALRGPSVLAANTWSHLAFTWDGATSRLYVNGAQVASAALAGTAATSTGSLRIGGNSIWGEWFGGAIDEVRVYNRALSAAEVAVDRDTPVAAAAGATALRAAHGKARIADTRRAKRAARRTRHAVHCGTRWLKNRRGGGGAARPHARRESKECRRAHHRPHRETHRL